MDNFYEKDLTDNNFEINRILIPNPATKVPLVQTNIIMLNGSQDAVQDAMEKYKVYAKKEKKEEFSDYLMNHTSVVYVMGTSGEYLSSFAHSTNPDVIKSTLLK